MNSTALEAVLLDHVEMCRQRVVQIDTYIKDNILSDTQLRYARIRREAAKEIWLSARAVLQTLRDAQRVHLNETLQRRVALIRETGGDLYQKFLIHKKQHGTV